MEWIWIVIAAGVAIYFWQRSSMPKPPPQIASRIGMSIASDRTLVLSTFRRELANYLVRLDPDRYLRFYQRARHAEIAIEKADEEQREAQLTIITKQYPFYADFDLVGTRDHVLYADALSMHSMEDIEERYLDLVKIQALQRALDPDWQSRSAATSDEDLEHLQEYVQKIKNTKFRQRLVAAVNEFFARRQSSHLIEHEVALAYETDVLAVYYMPQFAESRFGFHFKDTNEFGLYGSFYDESRDKAYQSFYRSDRKFEAEHGLDCLRIDEPI